MLSPSLEVWLLAGLAAYVFFLTSGLGSLIDFGDDDTADTTPADGDEEPSEPTPEEVGQTLEEVLADPTSLVAEDVIAENTLPGTEGEDVIEMEQVLGAGPTQGGFIEGFQGDDSVSASYAPDWIYGGSGDDIIEARLANDYVFAGAGNDTAGGGWQNDVVFGESGDDLVTGLYGHDVLFGGSGNDQLGGGLFGQEINDTSLPVDTLFGGSGDDTLFIGPGGLAHGGEGSDLYILDGSEFDDDRPAMLYSFNPFEDQIQLDVTDMDESPTFVPFLMADQTTIGLYMDTQQIGLVLNQPPGAPLPTLSLTETTDA